MFLQGVNNHTLCFTLKTIIFIVLKETKQTFAINLFQEKMSFTSETSTIEKGAKYRSETKNIQFFYLQCLFCIPKDW